MIVFRRCLQPLGKLVSLEMGKIVPEGVGEVQVGIDREGCGRGPGRDCSRGVGEVQVGIAPEGCGRGPGRDYSRGVWKRFR